MRIIRKLALAAALLLSASVSYAQEECSTMWPYLYPEFREGTIYKNGGQKFVQKVNVHTLKGRLHFIDGGVVKEVTSSDVLLLEVGEDRFMNVDGAIMKVVVSVEGGFIAASMLADFEKLNDTGGAYGTSTTNSSTMKLSSLQVAGRAGQSYKVMYEERGTGETVPILVTYYVVTPGLVCKASRREVESSLPAERKAEFKTWLKSNKVKWNDPSSLLEVVRFISAE